MHDAPYQRAARGRVLVFDGNALPWRDTANPGLRLKPVRYDNERGEYLGLVAFDAFVRSGLHQHQGVATSFVLQGGLTDYHGAIGLHEVGINLSGATHDAIAYSPTVLVSRLEGGVTYPPEAGALSGLHAGSTHAAFVNPRPDLPPETNVAVDHLPIQDAGVPGLSRQIIFDYAAAGLRRRLVQWQLRPQTTLPAWTASASVDVWVRGGEVHFNGQRAMAHHFVVIEPGARVEVSSSFGALMLVWAEGRERWDAGDGETPPAASAQADLFGFA